MKNRKYNSHVQAEVKALTHQRVLEAAQRLFLKKWIDEMTLQDLAEEAGVTVQTLLRHFGSREQLLIQAMQEIDLGADGRRRIPESSDLSEIVTALVDYYDIYGPSILRCLAQEDRVPELSLPLKRGRVQHRTWIRTVFKEYLDKLPKEKRAALEDLLYANCEIYLWRIYLLDFKKTRAELERAWRQQLKAAINSFIVEVDQ